MDFTNFPETQKAYALFLACDDIAKQKDPSYIKDVYIRSCDILNYTLSTIPTNERDSLMAAMFLKKAIPHYAHTDLLNNPIVQTFNPQTQQTIKNSGYDVNSHNRPHKDLARIHIAHVIVGIENVHRDIQQGQRDQNLKAVKDGLIAAQEGFEKYCLETIDSIDLKLLYKQTYTDTFSEIGHRMAIVDFKNVAKKQLDAIKKFLKNNKPKPPKNNP